MEGFLELILSVLYIPFQSEHQKFKTKINRIPNKAVKILLKLLMILIPLALIWGLLWCCSCLLRGY